MSREIQPDYETQYLFPRSLEEWIGPSHPARFIREFVDALDAAALGLEDQEQRSKDPNGRPHYGPKMLLKLWLWAYSEGTRSSRELERSCRDVLPAIWLAGNYIPDHNTLWRFWNRYRETIKRAFLMSVKVAMEANVVGMVLHAVDGTKIKSAASKRKAWHREDLEKALLSVTERISKLEEQIESAGAETSSREDELPKKLQNQQALQSTIRAALEKLEAVGRTRMHSGDEDARVMVTGGKTEFAFNAQAVVDEKHGVIVAADVTIEENDERQLKPMLEQVKENTEKFAAVTVADSGYHTAEGLGTAKELGADVLVALKEKDQDLGPYHTRRFQYDEQTDTVTCPQGKTLNRRGTTKPKNKPTVLKTYHCRQSASCPVATQCSKDRRGRVIEISPHHSAVEQNRLRSDARDLLIRRQSVVERAFAEIKETLGLRRWSSRGLEAVKMQWTMMCAAMNLRRMIAARS